MSNTVSEILYKDLYILENEDNPHGSQVKQLYPHTSIDQVIDEKSPGKKTLRTLLEELEQEIQTGGSTPIEFPVKSVNGKTGNVNITKSDIGLSNVDNTSDDDKPLSSYQRQAVMDILESYDFDIALAPLDEHLQNMNNPHRVTFAQVNQDNSADELISTYLSRHNTSTSEDTHRDIRNRLASAENNITDINTEVSRQAEDIIQRIANHNASNNAHVDLFNSKEDVSNKALNFNTYDNKTYPTTRAVVEYLSNQISGFVDLIPKINEALTDINIVATSENLPMPSDQLYKKCFIIINGNNFMADLAICKFSETNGYYWDIKSTGIYTAFDSTYFETSNNGLSLNESSIATALLDDATIVERLEATFVQHIPDLLTDYYTKDDIDSKHFVDAITIVRGTVDGTIRYYINGNQDTMSDDVYVAGLKRLAFLDSISDAIEPKSLGAEHLRASYNHMFGNFTDQTGNTVSEISLDELAELIGGGGGSVDEDEVRRIAREEIHTYHNWATPEESGSFIYEEPNLSFEYDNSTGEVEMDIDSNGDVTAMVEDTSEMATVLENSQFQTDGTDLYLNVEEN